MRIKLEKILEYLFYIFIFVLPWQVKYIIKSAETNYNEIAIYLNYLVLLVFFVIFLFYFFKYTKNKENFDVPKHYLILLGLDLFIFVSLFLSPLFSLSIFKYLLFLLAIALFFIILNFKINIKKILLVFILSVFLSSLVAVAQFFSQEVFANKYLGISAHDPSVLGVSVVENGLGRFVRAYGGLDHPNIFGAMCFFALIFSIYLYLKYKFNITEKILFYFVYFILFLGLIISFSRSAYLALFSSLILVLFLLLFEKQKVKLKKYFIIFIYSIIFSAFFFFILQDLVVSRFNTNSRLEVISKTERVEQVYSSADIVRDNFWLGVGYGAYHQKLIDLNPEIKAYQAQPVHNVFLLVLSEIGIWGLIFFAWFLIYIFIKSSGGEYYFINYCLFLGLFVFMMLDHWLWSLPFGVLFLFFVLGIIFLLTPSLSSQRKLGSRVDSEY